jgi:two-component system sensor kinase FixL
MSWVTLIWAVVAGACLAMALPFLFVAISQRRAAPLFFVSAVAATVTIAAAEFAMMRAGSAQQFATALRWAQVPIFVLVVSIVGFIRLYFGTGRLWLGIAACVVRFVCLIIDFLSPVNLNFREITGLQHLRFLGETVSTPVGVLSSWTHVAELSSLLLLLFVVDASISLWRQQKSDSRRRALIVGGSITFFIVLAAGVTALIHLEIIQAPYLVSFPFVAIVVAMALELGYELFAATQVAKKLRESEERMRLAADAVNLRIWEWDLSKDEIWATNARRALLGWPASGKITLENFISTVHPDDRNRIRQAIADAIHKGQHFDSEYRLVLPDGIVRWMAARGSVHFDAHGNPARLLGISIEITARKQAEFESKQRRDELSHLSRVALVGELSASIAHELNQPLAGIQTNAGAGEFLIDRGDVDLKEIRELLADISADARRASDVVRGIRGMIKKEQVTRRRINLNDVVTNVVRIIGSDALLRGCVLKTSLEAALPMVEADPVQIQQVLINLIVNAFDAMCDTPVSKREVEIMTQRNGDGSVCISVRDYGVGISEEMRNRIFEQFFTTKPEGLGMGLAIVRSIVEAHAGTIEAENAEGEGARFHFTLPVSAGD